MFVYRFEEGGVACGGRGMRLRLRWCAPEYGVSLLLCISWASMGATGAMGAQGDWPCAISFKLPRDVVRSGARKYGGL